MFHRHVRMKTPPRGAARRDPAGRLRVPVAAALAAALLAWTSLVITPTAVHIRAGAESLTIGGPVGSDVLVQAGTLHLVSGADIQGGLAGTPTPPESPIEHVGEPIPAG